MVDIVDTKNLMYYVLYQYCAGIGSHLHNFAMLCEDVCPPTNKKCNIIWKSIPIAIIKIEEYAYTRSNGCQGRVDWHFSLPKTHDPVNGISKVGSPCVLAY